MLERIPGRTVVIDEETKEILAALEKALLIHGLGDIREDKTVKSDLIADDSKQRKGLSKHVWNIVEKATGDAFGAKEKKFPEILIALDPDPCQLRDSYVSYLNRLIRNEHITPAEANNPIIKSPFVLVREILIRLCSVALSNDNDLKQDGSKIIDALIEFQILVISSHVLDRPGFFGVIIREKELSGFSKAFASSHLQWNNFLREMVKITKELHANIRIVSDTLSALIKWEQNIKRHLVARFCQDNSLKFEPGSLSPEWINDTLNNSEDKIINKYESIKTSILLNESENNLIALNVIEKPQFIKQKAITFLLQSAKKPSADKIKNLYDLFNRTRLVISIFSSVHSLFLIGGWIPIMMGVVNLKNISKLLTNHVNECEKTLKINEDDLILKGFIGYDFGTYQVDISKLGELTIACSDGLKKLEDSSLIIKLKQRFEGNLSQLSNLEKIVNIKMINTSGA